ncbi:hypothetical protein Tco_1289050, partial [Tanacetum coccineum]
MDITRAEQLALDDALVAPANRIKIGKSNLRLSSDLKSKEATLQVVYDVLKLTPFYKAFQILADVPEIYMQEFWATATICPKLPNQQLEELPFEEAILKFLRDLGHNGEIKMITDVNVNKLHQPWRSFALVINKCLSGKSTGYDNLRLSQAQILWGMYHKKNVDYAYLLKKKLHTQGLETLSEVALTEEEQMRIVTKRSLTEFHSSHASGSGADEGTGIIPRVPDVPTYESDDEQISWKSSEEEDDDEVGMNEDDDDNDDDNDDDGQEYVEQDDEDQDDDNEQTDSDNDGDDFVHPKFSTHDEEDKEEDSFDPRVQTPSHVESTDDESNEEIQGANDEGEEMDEEETNEEDEENELYKDVNVNLVGRDTEMTDAPRNIIQTTQVIEDTHVIITPVNPEGQQQSSSVTPRPKR